MVVTLRQKTLLLGSYCCKSPLTVLDQAKIRTRLIARHIIATYQLHSSVMTTLDKLKPGQRGIIHAITDSDLTPKLLEMGLLPGKEVIYQLRAPLGDPIAVRVSGYQLSLRLDEAHLVELV